ncbi:hypothetical protein JST56_07250 [Candidatus Dependentiae bacterium]|nr:hypothetical protein [Candidatus Dependentiae bacterium]
MQQTHFRFEGVHWPLSFFEDYQDETTFLAKAGKQHYQNVSAEQREKMLKEVWKQANDIKAANEADAVPAKKVKNTPATKQDDKQTEGK